MTSLKSRTKKILLSTLVASSLVTSAFATTPFIDGNFSTANLDATTMYNVFYEDRDSQWLMIEETYTDSNLTAFNGTEYFYNNYTIVDGMMSFFDDEGTDTRVKITDYNSSLLTICWENASSIDSCTVGSEYYFSDEIEAGAFVTTKNAEIAANSVDVTLTGQITFVDENNNSIAIPTDAGIRITSNVDMDSDNWGRFSSQVDSNGSFSITNSLLENTYDVNNTFQVVVFKNHINTNEFNWDCGENTYKYITNPDGSSNVGFESWSDIVVTPTDFQDRSSETCGDYVSDPMAEANDLITTIESELAAATDMPTELRETIETLIAEAKTILEADTLDTDALTVKLAEIYAIVDTIGDEDAYLYGSDSSKITGTLTIPTEVNLTSESDCFDTTTYMPLPSCNAVFVDLKGTNGEWLGSTMIGSDGSYTLYFRELATSEEINATLEIHAHLDGVEEHYFYDFGDNHLVGTDDSIKSGMEIDWIEDTATGMWNPDVNHLTISTAETTLNVDISSLDDDKYIVEGTVVVPADFTPGEIWGSNGEWLGFQNVNLTAIDTTTGNHYWTEIGRTPTDDTNTTYPFKFKLPNAEGNYTIRIEKLSDTNGATEWLEMYLNDGGDQAFGTDTLVGTTGVMWNEIGSTGIWIPDTAKTGYFTVSDNVSGIAIDITTFGNNFYKIAGTITPPTDFNTSSFNDNINIDIIDAKTGMWLGGSPMMCDSSDNCTYSVVLGNTLNNYDGSNNGGYIIQLHQNHWDDTDWANSCWKEFYFDLGTDNAVGGVADTIKDGMDVRWTESNESDTYGNPYWKPDVNEFKIADGTAVSAVSDVNISFGDYTAPTTYTISGQINGVDFTDPTIKWANIHLYDPVNYTGTGAELNSDGSFTIQNVKGEGSKYILEVNYDVEESGTYKHYHYIVVDDDGDFTSGASVIDGMEVKWVPYETDGTTVTSLESSTFDPSFDWSSVDFWAPVVDGKNVMIEVTSDIAVSSVSITQASLYNFVANLSGAGDTKNANFNLFVPNEPIGRWQDTTTDGSGDANVTLRDLKSRTDYQLQIWIDELGEFWYDGTSLISDVYWVGTQDGSVCDDWKTETWDCNYTDYSNPVVWGPNIAGFTIDADTTLNLAVPNDRAKVTATLDLSALSLSDGTYVDVNMWEQNGNGYAWNGYPISNDEINVSLNVKHGSGYAYRMEIWISSLGEGYVVDLGTDTNVGGTDDKLITQQNSWNTSGAWGPKSTTLIPVVDANDVVLTGTSATNSGLVPPTLSTLTFTIDNLDVNGSGSVIEQMFIDLEALDANNDSIFEWYGMDNADWSDWQNPTFSNTITVKVPDNANGYRVMIHPQNHKGGLLMDGSGDTSADANETIAPDTTVTTFSWDWSKADKITVSGNQAYTITLPAAADLKSITGTVSGITGSDMSGWIHAWSPTAEGNGAEVSSDGTFTIKGLTAADDYTIEYWSWTQDEMIKMADVNVTNDVTSLSVTKSSTVHTLAGQVDNGDGSTAVSNAVALLIDIDSGNGTIDTGDSWKVIDDSAVDTNISYIFNVPPPLNNHYYLVAVGVEDRNATSGATTFNVINPAQDSNIQVGSNTGNDSSNVTDINASVDGIGSDTGITVRLDHSTNQ